jgi:FkbM family methyltransferase
MLSRIQDSIRYRARWAKLGVFYARKPDLSSVTIAGRRLQLSLPAEERSTHEWEFGKIVFEDCYRLADIKHPVRTVLDVGANIGLFTIAARKHFPSARIHSYEPNPDLKRHLEAHSAAVDATCWMVAVGASSGFISLQKADSGSLFSVAKADERGKIPKRAFADAVAELGTVDLLKLDCEGAEWEIFSDPAPWDRVRSLVMEYHLWAKPNSTTDELQRILHGLGFGPVTIQSDGPSWGMAFTTKAAPRPDR